LTTNQHLAALPNWAVGLVLLGGAVVGVVVVVDVVFECGCNDGCAAGVYLFVRTVDFDRSVVEFPVVVVAVVVVVVVVVEV